MRHRVFFAALLAAVAAIFVLSATAVAGQPINGCTSSYTLIRAKVDPVVDKNGDGWICTKPVGNGSNGFNDVDNTSNH